MSQAFHQKKNPYGWSRSTRDVLPGAISVDYYGKSTALETLRKLQTNINIKVPIPQQGTYY